MINHSKDTWVNRFDLGNCMGRRWLFFQWRQHRVKYDVFKVNSKNHAHNQHIVAFCYIIHGYFNDIFIKFVSLHRGEAMYISLIDFQWTSTEKKSFQ